MMDQGGNTQSEEERMSDGEGIEWNSHCVVLNCLSMRNESCNCWRVVECIVGGGDGGQKEQCHIHTTQSDT
jgi:hypothetical protein